MAAPTVLDQPQPHAAVWRAALNGASASLVGIGIARFAYTPLIPALAAEHWFTASQAAYLGAANLAGYLAGALLGHAMTRLGRAATILRLMMLLTVASLFACEARALGLIWFTLWRFLSGYTGGVIMVLAAPTVLAATPPERRGLVGGAVFTGVGVGVAVSGTLVPFLLEAGGLVAAWGGLGALSLLLTIAAWRGWPREVPLPPAGAMPAGQRPALPVMAVLAEYGLNAVGLVPHMIFLVVFVAQGLDRGLAAGAVYWVIFGLGSMVGPLLAGRIADRIGFGTAFRLAFVVEAAAVLLPALLDQPILLGLSSFIAGAFTPGVVPLALGRLHELIPHERARRRAWGQATTSWALAQAGAAYAYAYLFSRFESYGLLFVLGAVALVAALVVDLAAGAVPPQTSSTMPS